MKVKFETNRDKIRNLQALDDALQIITAGSKEGYFKSKGESQFKKFTPDSQLEDAKLIELHIIKTDGVGEYKFNGNLSYNFRTKEVKFYILSVVSFDDHNLDENKVYKFINEANATEEQDVAELTAILERIKKTKPQFNPRAGGGRHSAGNGGNRDNNRKPGGRPGGQGGNYSRNNNNSGRSSYNGGQRSQNKEK